MMDFSNVVRQSETNLRREVYAPIKCFSFVSSIISFGGTLFPSEFYLSISLSKFNTYILLQTKYFLTFFPDKKENFQTV